MFGRLAMTSAIFAWQGAPIVMAKAAARPAIRIDYIILEGGGPDQGPGRDVKRNMSELRDRLGPVDARAGRMYGYGVQQIRMLTRSTDFLSREIESVLDAAEQGGLPVFLHLDPLYAWGADGEARADDAPSVKFWKEPDMSEWMAFPEEDATLVIPRLWFNWGPWCSPVSAVPAIGSPMFVGFARRQLSEGILKPLAARLDRWRAEGREHLFAGINIGWEVHIPSYSEEWLHAANGGRPGPVVAEYPDHVRGLFMEPFLVGRQLGYASLHWRGWSEARLAAAAGKEGISRDEKFRQICYEVIHDYMAALARECAAHGIAADKVYTHIVALATVRAPDTTIPPVWAAVNPWSTPGFTLDNQGAARFDLETLRREISVAQGGGEPSFGAMETYFGLNGRDYVTDSEVYHQEIEKLFAAGAHIKVIYGAFPLDGPRAPQEAFVAIRAWLRAATSMDGHQTMGAPP
jgi:hypothetical protein